VLTAVVGALPEEAHFNRVLGATAPQAATGGHLEEALEWVEELGVEARVPVTPERPETVATEALLERRGYSPAERRVRFVRPAGPPDFPEPPGIAVVEVEECVEGFAGIPGVALDLDLIAHSFLDCLPGREAWRGYMAYDADGNLIAAASMFAHLEVALLGFAGTREEFRGRGAHLALLRRRIADARTPRCHTLCAEVELSPEEEHDDPHPAIRNLVRAGFKQMAVRPVWRR
jgi:GNAT superfamily N-acetyltransferase